MPLSVAQVPRPSSTSVISEPAGSNILMIESGPPAGQEFMNYNGMPREQAEVATHNALLRMPAWQGGAR